MSSVTMPEGMTEEDALNVYKNYKFEHQYDENLAITKHRAEVSRLLYDQASLLYIFGNILLSLVRLLI